MSKFNQVSTSITVTFLLVAAITVTVFNCGGSSPQSLLVKRWITTESNVDRDLISEKMEFFGDGTGVMESSNIRGIGVWAESFTWKIGSDGRLIVVSPNGVTQIYEIVEISKSKLILNGNAPKVGNVRTTFLSQAAVKDAINAAGSCKSKSKLIEIVDGNEEMLAIIDKISKADCKKAGGWCKAAMFVATDVSDAEKIAMTNTISEIDCEARLIEAGVIAKMAEAPRVIASYQSAFLAAEAEFGFGNFTKENLMFDFTAISKSSESFDYTVSNDVSTFVATAKKDIGAFKKGSTLTATWKNTKQQFIHGSSQQDVAQELVPSFFFARGW